MPKTIPFSNDEEGDMEIDIPTIESINSGNIPLAAMIACKASFRKSYYYALFKYQLGCILHSNATVDLNPHYYPYLGLSVYPDDHVRLGYAIILFYSCIEELGMEIRASNKNPSFIRRQWNPIVRRELETRLRNLGVNLNEPILWTLRSTPTKIEKRKKPEIIGKANWAAGLVRDSKVAVVDAISAVSWLRSKVASHKLSAAVSSISIYDVSNTNILARRLLLERLGYWNHLRKI